MAGELAACGGKFSPLYMAPEQMRNAIHDGRAAVYSLGVMVYQMLTGALPFEGVMMMAMLKLTEEPPSLRTHNPAITRDLDEVVLLALDADAMERPTVARFEGMLVRAVRE